MHAFVAKAGSVPRVMFPRPSERRPMPKLDGEAWLACLTSLSRDQLDRPDLWPARPKSCGADARARSAG